MMKFNKINFGLLILLFLCRFENILGTSDKNIEEGLKRKYKIVDLDGNILKNEKDEDFSFIVTCKCNGMYYKWFKGIESDIEKIEKEQDSDNRRFMENKKKKKSSVSSGGDIVKTKDGRVLVVKDETKNKVYLVLGKYDEENSKTANIFLDKNYKLQTSGPCDIEENNTIHVLIGIDKNWEKDYCGGELLNEENNLRKFKIVCCELKEVKPDVILKELVDPFKKSIEQKDDFVKDSGCCDRLCNWCKDLSP